MNEEEMKKKLAGPEQSPVGSSLAALFLGTGLD
jgi:hypothetical protein